MEILLKIKETIENFKDSSEKKEDIKKLLIEISSKINIDTKKIASLNMKIVEKNDAIKNVKNEINEKNKKLEKALAHCEFLEPIFELFKKQSLGRLKLLNISEQTKKFLIDKIKESSYSDEIMEILKDIELKFKDDFLKDKTEFNGTIINEIKNPQNYKSG